MRTILNLLLLLILMVIYLPLAIVAITFGQVFRLLDKILQQFDKLVSKLS